VVPGRSAGCVTSKGVLQVYQDDKAVSEQGTGLEKDTIGKKEDNHKQEELSGFPDMTAPPGRLAFPRFPRIQYAIALP